MMPLLFKTTIPHFKAFTKLNGIFLREQTKMEEENLRIFFVFRQMYTVSFFCREEPFLCSKASLLFVSIAAFYSFL